MQDDPGVLKPAGARRDPARRRDARARPARARRPRSRHPLRPPRLPRRGVGARREQGRHAQRLRGRGSASTAPTSWPSATCRTTSRCSPGPAAATP
nr:hypothetical protein [Angustibacter aerolatus]